MANLLEKAEYSDLYKFLTSVGILVIGLSIILPWLFLRDQLAVQVMSEDYEGMLSASQELTLEKLRLIKLSLSVIVVMSPTLFFLGIILTAYGIRRWNVKQRGIDELDQLELAEKRAQVRPLEKSEYQSKAQAEVNSESREVEEAKPVTSTVDGSEPQSTVEPIPSDALANQLIEVEAILFDRFIDYNSFDYRIQRNVKLANRYEVDMLLAAYNTSKHVDKLIEIKYFQNRLNMDTVVAARDELAKTMRYYNASTRRSVQSILILVYRTGISTPDELNRFKETVPTHEKPPSLTIKTLSDQEASSFDVKTLLS